tara:strand:+ start:193 stop:495 length:303 start_codon:yes stop_codon:yes gene_type:complete
MTILSDKIKQRFDHEAAKQTLKEKYEAKLIFASCGGMWRAGPTLITLLTSIEDIDNPVILDLYGNPVSVNRVDLLKESKQRWQEQMNAWLVELTEVSQKR